MVVDVLGYFSAPSGGYVFSVAPAGAQFTSIQAAVDAAAALATANQPYLVRVAPGLYNEQVTLKDFVDV
jgi:pectin methylesterase-like acyl-CoA thioesterase